MSKQKKPALERNVTLEGKFIIATVIAGLLYYLSYLLKFPNTYHLIVSAIFLISLIKNISSKKGIAILVYVIIFSMIATPLAVFSQKTIAVYSVISLMISLVLLAFIAYGLKNLKKWGFYLAAIVFGFSLLNALSLLIMFFKNFSIINFPFIIQATGNIISLLLLIACLFCLIKSRGYFKK